MKVRIIRARLVDIDYRYPEDSLSKYHLFISIPGKGFYPSMNDIGANRWVYIPVTPIAINDDGDEDEYFFRYKLKNIMVLHTYEV